MASTSADDEKNAQTNCPNWFGVEITRKAAGHNLDKTPNSWLCLSSSELLVKTRATALVIKPPQNCTVQFTTPAFQNLFQKKQAGHSLVCSSSCNDFRVAPSFSPGLSLREISTEA